MREERRMMDERIKKFAKISTTRISDRRDAKIFFVRIRVPKIGKVVATAVEVEDAWVDSPQIKSLSQRDGLSREEVFYACAIDSVRIQLERSGFARSELQDAAVVECRQVTAQGVKDLQEQYAKIEGN
jgi:hypothetical protein